MAFSFKIQMLGLCMFVDNKKDFATDLRELRVIIPHLSGNRDFGALHHARLIYSGKYLMPPDTQAQRLSVRSLVREIVTFKFYKADGSPITADGVKGDFDHTVNMAELVGPDNAAKCYDILHPREPHESVMTQIYVKQGNLKEVMGSDYWHIPQYRRPDIKRTLPSWVYVEVPSVSEVHLNIDSFENETYKRPPKVLRFRSNEENDVVHIILTSDCQLVEAEKIVWPALKADAPDMDFHLHYHYLKDEALLDAFGSLDPRDFSVPIHLPPIKESDPETVLGGPAYVLPSGELVQGFGTGGSDCQSCVLERELY